MTPSCPSGPTEIIADIDFRANGNSAAHRLEGWGEQERTHCWTVGRESRVHLKLGAPAGNSVVVLTMTPCVSPPTLPGQTVMLAIDGRLLATIHLDELHVTAHPLPPGTGDCVLSLVHLSAALPRPTTQMRQGEPLGLMVHRIRVFRLGIVPSMAREPGQTIGSLASCFESLGQGCQFGLIQRQCGIEPLSLLRFVDTMTALLFEGLLQTFAGIGNAADLQVHNTPDPEPRYHWHQTAFGLLYDTRIPVAGNDPAQVQRSQSRRLDFLRSKFAGDLRTAEKIFVLTRTKHLTEPEALAIHCALTLHGPNTLLWTLPGVPDQAGQVDVRRPGFLRAELGQVDQHGYGSLDTWLCIMRRVMGLPDGPD